ncbi:MAG TPA: hypothetical protein VER03_12055, partial [Bryobacteraceae bacterium]|nr:hypothetical protein [Bryobacteraceae bacterium]
DKPGATRITHAGLTVLGDERGAVAFLNPTTAIAGKIDDVLRTLDLRNQNTGLPDPLEKLTSRIPSKYDVWFASTGIAPAFIQAGGVKSAYGGLNLSTGKHDLVVEAETGSQSIQDAPVPESIVDWVLGNAPTAARGLLRQ